MVSQIKMSIVSISFREAFIYSKPCARSTQGMESHLIPRLTISNTWRKIFKQITNEAGSV